MVVRARRWMFFAIVPALLLAFGGPASALDLQHAGTSDPARIAEGHGGYLDSRQDAVLRDDVAVERTGSRGHRSGRFALILIAVLGAASGLLAARRFRTASTSGGFVRWAHAPATLRLRAPPTRFTF
jgi:hypothetical protein